MKYKVNAINPTTLKREIGVYDSKDHSIKFKERITYYKQELQQMGKVKIFKDEGTIK